MNDNDAQIVSKVLVIDSNKAVFTVIKLFCIENNLVGLRAHRGNVMDILKSNVDLGAILLSEHYCGNPTGGVDLARQINRVRPELPIFLRRDHTDELDDLDPKTRKLFCAAYTIGSMFRLRRYVEEYIFSFVYPNVLVRGIKELTETVLASQFANITVNCDTPYVVRDRIVCGEVFSLIPIESSWCRGYMMMQTDDPALRAPKTEDEDPNGFDKIADRLSEITNLILGAFKHRFIAEDDNRGQFQTQVPMLIKLHEKFISFGSNDPQLCYKYTLANNNAEGKPSIHIYQRFVFNLNWSPDDFKEVTASYEELVDSGELELF